MIDPIDARSLLSSLTGHLIHTLSGQPNHVLRVDATEVIVATQKSPDRRPAPIEWVQVALDRLVRDGEIEISVASVGYRSAFVGAVLATIPGARTMRQLATVRLDRNAVPGGGGRGQ